MLLVKCWLTKIHTTPIGAKFIAASKNCSTNPLCHTIFKIFKMIFNTVESFHRKSFFYSGCIKFWIVRNLFPNVTMLNKINVKKKTKSISSFDFSTLYIIIPHKVILKVLSGVINFVFKTKVRKRIGFSKTFIYRTSNVMGERYFTKQTLISAMCSHISKCFFTIGNIVFK